MADVYEKLEEYIQSTFAYSNASQAEMDAARSAFVAGWEERKQTIDNAEAEVPTISR